MQIFSGEKLHYSEGHEIIVDGRIWVSEEGEI
jgi:hypothetical protein